MSQRPLRRLITIYKSKDNNNNDSDDNQEPSVTINEGASNTPARTTTADPPRTEARDSQPIGLLTQLLEPKKSKQPATANRTLDDFRQTFLDKTTTLDRARAHLDSLTSTQERERITAKLRINIQRMVIDKNNRTFQTKWNDTLRNCENKLLELIKHLNNTIFDTITTIRTKSNECLMTLKQTQSDEEAKANLKTILEDAKKLQQERKDITTKKKRERAKSQRDPNPKEPKRPRTE